tara:strand:- start:18180 stop:20177 length:1998 start_codon:yes stop_codon:yes gene_type:complete
MLLSLLASLLFATSSATAPHVEVSFIHETQELVRGEDNYLAFYFEIDEDWHIYWKNPGDSGKEPRITWLETSGLNPSEIIWPAPHKMPIEILMNYGYDGQQALPLKVFVPENFAKDEATLTAQLSWLICKVECIPGKAELSLTLAVANSSSPTEDRFKIRTALHEVPLYEPNLVSEFTIDEFIHLNFDFSQASIPKIQSAYFYVLDELVVQHAAGQRFVFKDGLLSMSLKKDINMATDLERLNGVLELIPENKDLERITYNIEAKRKKQDMGLLLSLAFAFLGGIILNLMPCVFPVLSLKILSFVHQAKEEKKSVRIHGWYYTLGVLISFWALTLALIVLKASGEAVGWGFQLQSPYFVTAMAFLFFFIGLNLLGFFEVGESLSAVGGRTSKKEGYFSSLQTGVLATIVATPCTAPFMGAAIGTAFSQPAWQTFSIFSALALGMASPYILLSHFPQWLKLLPKPGLWMKTFKEFLAFPMLATMLWLLWVLQPQTSSIFIFVVLLAFLSILFLFWLQRYWKRAKVFFLIAGAFIMATTFLQIPERAVSTGQISSSAWQPYSNEKLENLLSNQQAVFIDFTAKWCITCQVNKKLVLNTDAVQNYFSLNNITLLQADWTNSNPEITKKLAEFGRNSVPLYIYYPPGSRDPKILPEILSKDMIFSLTEE